MENYGQSAYELLEKLNYIRVAGTEGEHRAAEVFTETLKTMGITAKSEPFEIDAYDIKTAKLKVTAPFEQEYTVTGYGLSGSTSPEGLRAPFLYAEDGNDISLAKAKGKIILLNSHVNADKYKEIVEAGALGFITISGAPIDELDKTDLECRALRKDRHLKNGEIAQIPGVTIRAKDTLEMLRKNPEEVVLTLIQDEKKATSHNVIAEIKGEECGLCDEWVTFGAHYDSVPFSRGMYDNASGSVILMEACRYFSVNKPKRSLRFIWFGAEEKGLLGSLHHVANSKDELKTTKLMINVDLAGHVIGSHMAAVSADECLGAIIRFMAQEIGFGLTVRQDIFSSDSSPYADSGVPAVSFYRGGTGGHNRYDIIDLISPDSLGSSTRFLIHFSERIINSEVFPVPAKIPDGIKEKLEVYFGRKASDEKKP